MKAQIYALERTIAGFDRLLDDGAEIANLKDKQKALKLIEKLEETIKVIWTPEEAGLLSS